MEANPRLNELLSLLPFEQQLVKVIQVHTLYCDSIEYNAAKMNIEGASWARWEGACDKHMTIKHDRNEYDATLVIFEQPSASATGESNFITLQNIDVKEIDVTNISRLEQTRIDSGQWSDC